MRPCRSDTRATSCARFIRSTASIRRIFSQERTLRTPDRVCTAGSMPWREPGGEISAEHGACAEIGLRWCMGGKTMTQKRSSIRNALLAGGVIMAVWPASGAEVTRERLINADQEPQNWLMNHRTYNGQRYSPLARINKSNVRGLKLAYAVALGGGAGNEFNEATPLAEDGYLYITDSWGVLYKIDGRSGDAGRIIWRMDPKQERQQANRGAALWGNLVITPANHPARIIATDKETGKVVWETNVAFGAARMNNTGAPLVIKNKVLFGAAGSDAGWRGWIPALHAATGKPDW